MYLTIDTGNSNIVNIVYDKAGRMVYKERLISVRKKDKQYYEEAYKKLKDKLDCKIETVALSSVVPAITGLLTEVLEDVFKCRVINVTTKTVDLKVELKNPEELGADFVAGAVAVLTKYKQPTIIIDMGTASKISVVDEPNHFLGGIIQPGIRDMADILHQNIPQLPNIELKVPDKVIGNDTMESIQSGIMYGSFLSLIALAKEIEKEIGKKSKIVLTGGYINLYKDLRGYEFNPDLVNEGLLEIAVKETENGSKK